MATIHLIEGLVGAGKSTFAAKLSLTLGAPHLNLDEWMVTLFYPDRPDEDFMAWYLETKDRCIQQIWDVTTEILSHDVDVVLELGLVQAADRARFYGRVDGTDVDLRVYVLDTPVDVRRERVRERNRQKSGTFKMEVSDEVFEMANGFWEEPTDGECRERAIEVIGST